MNICLLSFDFTSNTPDFSDSARIVNSGCFFMSSDFIYVWRDCGAGNMSSKPRSNGSATVVL